MEQEHFIWKYSPEEIARGYVKEAQGFRCTLCGALFEQGRIYPGKDGSLYDAFGAVRRHISDSHGDCASFLLDLEPRLVALSELTQSLLRLINDGQGDREIAAALGIAPSTVRNHRFKLREKEKQARLFLALMLALEEKTQRGIGQSDLGALREVPPTAAMVDDRYAVADKEQEKVIKNYFDDVGALRRFPSKEKKKIIVLQKIVQNFKRGVSYSEPEVNRVLKRIYPEDHVTIRRALIEYGLMDRSPDGRVYRVKE